MLDLIAAIQRRLHPPRETLSGYEHPELVDVVFKKTIAFDPGGGRPDLTGASAVLDFGGGCGVHYKQTRSHGVRWAVVETSAMVARAKELATDRLQFFTDISDASAWLGPIDIVHSNGALQYAPDPLLVLERLCGLGARKMIWDRVKLSASDTIERIQQTSHLVDNGPGRPPPTIANKRITFSLTKIPEAAFLAAHENGYRLIERGADCFRFERRDQ